MKDDKIQIAVNTMNWGPCVVKLKILDNFKKVLLDEAKKTELDFRDRSEVHQCWDCDSEGEFYEEITDDLIDDGPSDRLH